MLYKKREPLTVDAWKVGVTNMPDWVTNKVTENIIILKSNCPVDAHIECRNEFPTWCELHQHGRLIKVQHGDYIFEENGDVITLPAFVFDYAYELVKDEEGGHIND